MIGKRLIRLRLENGITQRTFWKISGVSYVQISRYENGFTKPQANILVKLVKALGVDSSFFTNKKIYPDDICIKEHLEKLKQVVKTHDDEKMLIALTEILYHKNRIDFKKKAIVD